MLLTWAKAASRVFNAACELVADSRSNVATELKALTEVPNTLAFALPAVI